MPVCGHEIITHYLEMHKGSQIMEFVSLENLELYSNY